MTIDIKDLMTDFSLEMTGKEAPDVPEAQPYLPSGTRVNVTFLGNEDLALRTTAAAAIKRAALVPVPHISARRLASEQALTEFLSALHDVDSSGHIFVIAGDPPTPAGPYKDSLDLIETAHLADYGVQTISIGGYPEGHPEITEPDLWAALDAKVEAVTEQGRQGDIITQLGFNVDAVITWIEQVRSRGIWLPIRVGVPGPAGVRRLLGYARRFGVGPSASIAKKYGFSLTNLLGTAGPDRFLTELAGRLDPAAHGSIRVHLYTFGGLRATAQWVRDFTEREDARA